MTILDRIAFFFRGPKYRIGQQLYFYGGWHTVIRLQREWKTCTYFYTLTVGAELMYSEQHLTMCLRRERSTYNEG